MSLVGVDVGTTGCKATLFSERGRVLGAAYREYDISRPKPGWAELDATRVLGEVKRVIREASGYASGDPVSALSISSLGEAVVPVSREREVLSPSMLNFDVRGEQYLEPLGEVVDNDMLYRINGNTLGNNYTLTKLKWYKEYRPELYERTFKFLHWSGFIAYMMGAEPVLDYSLANRSLLFDVAEEAWSDELLTRSGLDRAKLPDLAPSGVRIGTVSNKIAEELGLPNDITIVSGAHDQCANALGCGVIEEGLAAYGMGTYVCITPVFSKRPDAEVMIRSGLNTEHHAVPGLYVCFLFNHGADMLKWYRDTFAIADHARSRNGAQSSTEESDIYSNLLAEMPAAPSSIIALPHFAPTGPPEFIADTCGVLAGLHLDTSRGDILKGILEGTTFYLKESVDLLPSAGIEIEEYRAVGGGSNSAAWIQICADILGKPFARPEITEAGTLGAAILAGCGTGDYAHPRDGVDAMVRLKDRFEPDSALHRRYEERFAAYKELYPLNKEYLRALHRGMHLGDQE